MKSYISVAVAVLLVLLVGQSIAADEQGGVKGIEARCAKYYTDAKARKSCVRDERRATMDIYDLIDELNDAGKPMKQASSSKEYSNEAVQRGKYFAACAILFELHKDRVECYRAGVKSYQEQINSRLAGKPPFAKP